MVYYELHSGHAWRMDYRGLEGSRKSWRGRLLWAGVVEMGTQDAPRAVRERTGPRDSLRPVRCRWQGVREGAGGHNMLEMPSGGWGQRQVWRLGRRGGAFCFSLGEGAGPMGPPGRRAQERAGAHRAF